MTPNISCRGRRWEWPQRTQMEWPQMTQINADVVLDRVRLRAAEWRPGVDRGNCYFGSTNGSGAPSGSG